MNRLFLSLLLLASAVASEPTDLGNNLSYLRVHSLADAAPSLKSALSGKQAFVLDLRYATATAESSAALGDALAGHPAAAPLFILVSPETAGAVVDAINPPHGPFITLGAAGSRPRPKITVKTEPAADRRAYDAFEAGTPIEKLISGKIEKDRYDEATLVEEFKSGNFNPEPELSPDPTKTKDATDADNSPESNTVASTPPKDRVLQRALNLYQALLALKTRR